RRGRQIADHHGVDHAPAQRADLSHRELLSDEVVQQPTLSDRRPRRQPLVPRSGFVVCPACSIAWGWKSPIQPDGGEGLAKHKGVIARWRLKAVRSKTAT